MARIKCDMFTHELESVGLHGL